MNLSLQALDFLHLEETLVVCIGLRSLHENIDTTSSAGKFLISSTVG